MDSQSVGLRRSFFGCFVATPHDQQFPVAVRESFSHPYGPIRLRDGEYRRTPRTLPDSTNALTPQAFDNRLHLRPGVGAALNRRKPLAGAGVELVQRLAERRQIAFE